MNIAEKLQEVAEYICYTKEELPENPTHKDMPEDANLGEETKSEH